jgi:hypothetical protein
MPISNVIIPPMPRSSKCFLAGIVHAFLISLMRSTSPFHLVFFYYYSFSLLIYCVRNVVANGDAREGKWRGNCRMEWVASPLTLPRNVVYPALVPLMRPPRLPAVDWTDSPADLNGLVRLGERWNLVSARVPSGSARVLLDEAPSCVILSGFL